MVETRTASDPERDRRAAAGIRGGPSPRASPSSTASGRSGRDRALGGRVCFVAGATRGRGAASPSGSARPARPYCSGRSTRGRRSEYDRPETIEETAELVTEAGGTGIGGRGHHLEPAQVRDLVQRIDAEQGRLDVLVNDIWGGEKLFEWNVPVWEHDLGRGLRMLRLAIDTHLNTSRAAAAPAQPGGLLTEVTDGTAEYNAVNYRLSAFYDLAKSGVIRIASPGAGAFGLRGATAVASRPAGCGRR